MQPSKVRKTPQKPTICPCGSTANAPKSAGQITFDAGVFIEQYAAQCTILQRNVIQFLFLHILRIIDVTAKSPKNAAKTTATLQNQVGKVLLTLAS
jgi:hypothetical protein